MRIKAHVNGAPVCLAALDGDGYLSAHLNLSHRTTSEPSERVLRLVGIETNETESVYLEWPQVELQEGDVVSLQLGAEGEATSPASRRTSSESPSNLPLEAALATDLLTTCGKFEAELQAILTRAKAAEASEGYEKLLRAVAHVASELGERLLYPVYRAHPSLVPEQLRGEIL